MKGITLYLAGNSFFHRLDPRTKLAWLIFAALSSFILFNPMVPLLVTILLTLALLEAVGRQLFQVAIVRLLLIIIISVIIAHGFVNPIGKTPVQIGEVTISLPFFGSLNWEGLYVGVVFAFRIACMTLASMLLVLTTSPEDMTSAITKLHIPFQYAFMFGMSLQMIPTMQREAEIIVQAQRARGLRENNFVEKVRALVPLFVPLAVGSMERVETTAMVLAARGFGAPVKRTELRALALRWPDYLVMTVGILVVVGLLVIRFVYGDVMWLDSAHSLLDLLCAPQLCARP